MDVQDHDNDPATYAKHFTGAITGSRYLIFRDIPKLIKEYVNGTLTLDYGCGPGESTKFLKSLGFEVEGMDINHQMIDLAKQKDLSGVYEVIKSGEIPRTNNYYDFVSATLVLVHASSKEELHKITKDIARVLKYKGTVLVVVNSNETFKYEWMSARTDFEKNKRLISGAPVKYYCKITDYVYNQYYWSEEDYCEALEKAGLKVSCIHKPRGEESDGWNWINETKHDYTCVFVAQKLSEKST